MKFFAQLLAGLLAASVLALPVRAEVSEIRITKQPGVIYLPAIIMEHDKLIEKQATKMGLGNIKTRWVSFTSGSAAADALMSGQVDMISVGTSNMLLLWDRTHGGIKGVAGTAVIPQWLLTRNPAVKTLKDFTDKDRIALPTVKVSNQVVFLKMASEQVFGPSGMNKLDPLTVGQGHPDATIALLSGKSNIDAHFSSPPYQQEEIKSPEVHRILTSSDIANGPVSTGVIISTSKFHDANPKLYAVFLAALNEAENIINHSPRAAAQKYLEVTHEKYSVDSVAAILASKENIYTMTPYGTLKFADVMYKDGMLKTRLSNWKDAYFPEVHHLPGN